MIKGSRANNIIAQWRWQKEDNNDENTDRTGKDKITSEAKNYQLVAQKKLSPSPNEGWAKATKTKRQKKLLD